MQKIRGGTKYINIHGTSTQKYALEQITLKYAVEQNTQTIRGETKYTKIAMEQHT